MTISQVTEVLLNSRDLLEEQVLGDIRSNDIPWMKLDFTIEREGLSNNINLCLTIKVIPQNLSEGRVWKWENLWFQRTTLSGSAFGSMKAGDAEQVVLATIKTMARQSSLRFYELDPRRGRALNDWPLPYKSPLFDPSGSAQKPDFFRSIYAKAHEGPGTREAFASYPGIHCVFCGKVMLDESPHAIVWGGGNLGWVHLACAPWKEPEIVGLSRNRAITPR